MKKLKLLLVLAVLSIAGAIGVAPSYAGANCAPTVTNIYYDGQWVFNANFSGCTQVNGIQVKGYEYGTVTGIDWPAAHRDYGTSTPTVTYYASNITSWSWPIRTPVFGPGCGSPPISVYPHYQFRLRNSNGSTWGAWLSARRSYADVIC